MYKCVCSLFLRSDLLVRRACFVLRRVPRLLTSLWLAQTTSDGDSAFAGAPRSSLCEASAAPLEPQRGRCSGENSFDRVECAKNAAGALGTLRGHAARVLKQRIAQ